MKKALFFTGLAAASLLFVGCNKEADIRVHDATPFEVVLGLDETRTAINPENNLQTLWAAGDQINVFHAEAGSADYKNDTPFSDNEGHPFVLSETASDTFQGALMGGDLEAGNSYDWYFFYPYNSYLKSPVNVSDARIYIGSRSDRAQTQNGYDSRLHLAGGTSSGCFPLYGVAQDVPAATTPVVSMKHIASAIAITVTNDTEEGITINRIEFTAPEKIVGNFYVSFEKEPLTITPYDEYASATAALQVENAPVLAAGQKATFYMGIKPFSAKALDKLTIKITADAGVVEKVLELGSAVEFKSGHIKPMNVSYKAASSLPTITVSDIKSSITSASDTSFEGNLAGATVTFVSGSNAFIQDETGGILLYLYGHTFKKGDLLSGNVSGTGKNYNGLKELTSLTVETVTADQPVPDPVELTLAQLNDDYDDYVSVSVKVKGVTIPSNFENRNTTMTDGEESLALRDQVKGLTVTPGKYDVIGFPSYYNAAQFGVWAQDDIISAGSVNIFDVTPEQVEVEATATSTQIHVTGNVAWTAEASEGATVDKTEGTGEAVITVSFPANTDTEHEKYYSVAVRTEAEGVNDEFIVDITQAKADASGAVTATVDFSAQNYENGLEMSATTINGVSFAFDKGENKSYAPKYYSSGEAVRLYGGNTMTVSVEGKTMTSITFTFSSGEGTNVITSDVPTYEEPTWTGEAGSVTFTIGGTTGHRRIQTVTVKYKDGGSAGPVTPSLTVSPTTVTVEKGETATITVNTNSDGAKAWSSSDATVATVADGVVTGVKAGTATITLSIAATENYKAATATIPVTVTETAPSGNTVSMTTAEYVAEHNCTVSANNNATMYKVLQLNESVRMSTTGEDNCGSFWGDNREWRLYQNKQGNVIISVANGCELKSVKLTFGTTNGGILQDASEATIASNTAYTVSGQSVTYTVGNSGTATNGQVKVTAVEVIYTGDGTTFPDNPEPPSEITTTISMAASLAVYVGETVSLNATSNVEGAPISYESEDTNIATVNASGVVTGVAEGSVKVYARIAAVPGEYTAAERYTTITVTTRPQETDGTVVFDQAYLAANKDGSKDPISYTNDTEYTGTVTELRVYKNKTLTVSASGDKKITSIKMTCTKNGTTKEGPGCWGDGAPEGYTFQTDGPVGTWTGSASSVSFTAKENQVRIIELVVTYE